MPVYVDHAKNWFGRMRMCHMVADSLDELHAMADRIGVARKWFQYKASTPHYDICQEKRAEAVLAGAVEVDRRRLVTLTRKWRFEGAHCSCNYTHQGCDRAHS